MTKWLFPIFMALSVVFFLGFFLGFLGGAMSSHEGAYCGKAPCIKIIAGAIGGR